MPANALIRFRPRHLATTPSTNVEIKEAIAAGEPEGLVVYADEQTGGYGRQGRTWSSPKGGMYASFLLRPQVPASRMPTLALVAGVAVAKALRSVAPEADAPRIGVKWPNDVLLDGTDPDLARKLCGISCEVVGGAVCIGIGVNVKCPADDSDAGPAGGPTAAPAVIPNGATQARSRGILRPAYLEDLAPQSTIDGVLVAVMRELAIAYGRWLDQGFDAVYDDFRQLHVLAGQAIRVVDINGQPLASGVVQSVDESGRLVLREPDGGLRRVSSGEAHIVW